jgi:2'-5' RNA ligase
MVFYDYYITILCLSHLGYFIIMIMEPFVKHQINEFYHEILGKVWHRKLGHRTVKKSFKFQSDSLSSFINSAINIEYVYIILSGISNFMDYNRNQSITRQSKMTGNLSNYKKTIKVKCAGMCMQDASKWNIERMESMDKKTSY